MLPIGLLGKRIAFRFDLSRRDLVLIPLLLLGGWLRFMQLDRVPFLLDEADIYAMAQDAVARHALPATGIVSSINSFNEPAAIYLYLPFALLRDPVFGAWATACANLIAVALTYLFARRYLGYLAAVVGTLLFAVAAWPVYLSRFIWQQNLLPPLVVGFVLLVCAGLAGKYTRWIAWALPLWGLMIQLHPTAAALGGLLVLGWALAPHPVRLRDVVLGAAITAVLYIPTLLWELQSNLFDVRALVAYGHRAPATDLDVIRQFLLISGIPAWSPWLGTTFYAVLRVLIWAVTTGSLLYVSARVIYPVILARRALSTVGARSELRARMRAWGEWLRSPDQTRWRIDVLLVVWPSLVILSQLRHSAPIQPFYSIVTFPVQFLVVGVAVQDLWPRLSRRRRASRRSAADMPRVSIGSPDLASGVLGLALIVLVVAQVAATPGLNPRVDQMPLSAEKAGLISAGRMVRSAHVSLVVFQPDFFTRESVLYMLRNGYGLDVATQIVEPSLCMPFATAPGSVTLYLFSGPISVSEHYLAQLPDVRDLFASGPAAAFFRAYLIESRSLEAHLVDMPAAQEAPLAAQFGGQVTVTRAVQVGVDEGATMFGLMGRLSAPPPSKPFATYYTALVRVQTSAGTDLATDQAPCNIYPWMASEAALFLFPRLSGDVLSSGDQAVISIWRTAYDLPDVRFGPLSLETAYRLTTVRYQLAATPASVALAAHCATTGITCGGAEATIALR